MGGLALRNPRAPGLYQELRLRVCVLEIDGVAYSYPKTKSVALEQARALAQREGRTVTVSCPDGSTHFVDARGHVQTVSENPRDLTKGENVAIGVGVTVAVVAAAFGLFKILSTPILPCFTFKSRDEMTPEERAQCDRELADTQTGRIAMEVATIAAGATMGLRIGAHRDHPILGSAIGGVSLPLIFAGIAALVSSSRQHQTVS